MKKQYLKAEVDGLLGTFLFIALVDCEKDFYKFFNQIFGTSCFRIKSKPVKTTKKIIAGLKEYDGYKNTYCIY